MVRARAKQPAPPPEPPPDDTTRGLDVNAVVSYNVRAIRERRAMTQVAVADALAALTGHQLPQASISAMERGFDGERRRRFDAHELYLLSVVFDVPIAYFFLPPPDPGLQVLADTGRPVAETYTALLGQDHQLAVIDERLAELNIHAPDQADDIFNRLYGPDTHRPQGREHFRAWRQHRLDTLASNYGDQLDEVAQFLETFARQIRAAGPAGYFQWMTYSEDDANVETEVRPGTE